MKKQDNIPENSSSFLDEIDKKNNFSVPKNYFKVLPEIINNKLLENNKLKKPFDILSWRVLTPSLSVLILFFVLFNYYNTPDEITLNNEELSELLMEENYSEIDDYLVYETYAEILEEEDNDITNSETEAYIDYLIENDIDINAIIEEL